MLFENISYVSPDCGVVSGAYIGTEGRHISYVGLTPPPDKEKYGRVIDGRDRLLIPGFYNAHSHLAMSLMRGYGEDLSLQDWLNKRIFPFEAKLQPEDIYWATLLGCAELVRYGAVGCSDMYLNCLSAGRAFADSGVKAAFSVCFTGSGDYSAQPRAAEAEKAAELYNMHDDGRLRVELSLHAEYTSDEALARSVAQAAKTLGLQMHIHVSETRQEVEQCRSRHGGLSPVQYLSECGLFDVPATAAHCVAIDERDMDILRDKKVTVASCPKSNLKLVSGICPVSSLLKRGVNVALGSDSVTSNNNLNMLEEARLFSLLQKYFSSDPAALSPAETLRAVTRAGALAQGREDCGLIAPGYRADLAMLDISGISWRPVYDLLNNLIYSGSGSDVCMTVCDGRILYENGSWPTLDIDEILRQTEKSRRRILSELN